jgi:D-alanyl-D-alanine carboxypeptidase/D-alanyl-D-alanine-endopeptidase (penicillin-binding protein 4)
VVVSSVESGKTLFAHNPDTPLRPASTQKLLTSVLAFERLGVNHRFETTVLRTGPILPDGTLQGDLYVRGGGDPSLAARFHGGTPEAPMRALARLVAQAGITRVTGDVVGDASGFADRTIPEGWLSRYLYASYAARVSALSLNGNLLHVAVTPGAAGKAASISVRPALSGIELVNRTQTRSGSRRARVAVSRRPDGTVVASGWIGSRAGLRVYTVVVDEPAKFATAAFHRALIDEGIQVPGAIRVAAAPASAEQVVALPSRPLYELASVMNGESDNHIAELLFRGASRGDAALQPGSASLGNRQLQDLLADYAGVPPNAINAVDGSGLSSYDRVTARAMTQVLAFAHRAPWAKEFHLSLPVAGRSETLRRRMIGTAAQGNLHAKTGTTAEVVSLAGYVTSRDGDVLTFAFLYNGKVHGAARETIDAMGATLAGYTRDLSAQDGPAVTSSRAARP